LGTVNSLAMMLAPMIGSIFSIHWGIQTIILMIPVFTALQVILLYRNRNVGGKAAPVSAGTEAERHD